ncbi:sigma-54-dependent Fis family transcriptional regulator [Neobacillus mesonae]|uniref:sigma-54 interaction domain-containing protein n=1 Tax=Neobacillus mesonae TaxID=1193713 RepID=UPI00203D54FF|nr:sigma 54-interacting transcriptional regulator [Neobacillus mesonae]MCM3567244.1 sigma 54-interacting transcriptional regulator [Neobacillus mesonae]
MAQVLNNKQMLAILEFTTDGIYVVDRHGVTMFVNRAYEQITGFSREQLVGRHMMDLIQDEFIDQSASLLVLEEKKEVSLLQTIAHKKEVIVTGNPVFAEDGTIEMVVTSVRDVTRLNSLQKDLSKAQTFSKMQNYRFTLTTDEEGNKFLFRDIQMKKIYVKATQIAPFPTSVLLTGPSGAGKEVIANLIHEFSDRKDKPFIKVNCGAIPETLLESEFFGYASGAFTGARREGKIGLLELANNGTIMLDEIGEMPIQLQVKLLRALQEKKIRRVGGTEDISVDIRLISATNQDIKNLIKQGKFREDLYYRIAVIELQIPPLCERREDIELLVDHYFEYYCQRYKIQKVMTPEAKRYLIHYQWPGNVRELKNIMENLVTSISDPRIEPYHLPYQFQQTANESTSDLKSRLEQLEKRIVNEAVISHPSIRQAAKSLGIDHSTLVKKLQKWRQPLNRQ